MDFDVFMAVARALLRENVSYVLVGGIAVNLHGIARATRDIDLFVNPDADNIARLKRALREVWEDPDIDEISADDLAGAFPAIRYGPPQGEMTIDILARLGEAFRYEDIEAETLMVEGTPVRVATPRMLVRMKRDTARPIDHADAEALRERYNLEDD